MVRRPTDSLSLVDARRLALAAQGFDHPYPRRVGVPHITATIDRLGLLQLDFVKVVCPSHYLILFARLGPFAQRLLEETIYRTGRFTEQWAHEASVIPIASWPLLRERMEVHRTRPWNYDAIMATHHPYVETVLTELQMRGPLSAADLPDPTHTERRLPGSWYGSVPRAVLEALFGRGQLAVVDRLDNHARRFDLADRVIPDKWRLARIDPADARRTMVTIAARALGVATVADLADYFRLPAAETRHAVEELIAAGSLRVVEVESWTSPAYMLPDTRIPPAIAATALLSPFDPVIWFRPRTRRLFGFDYRFEVFTPKSKRRWGSYVLPFLHGTDLVARVDLKADRAGSALIVGGAYLEPNAEARRVAPDLRAQLTRLAAWLGLDRVVIGRRGNLVAALRQSASPAALSR